MERQAQAEGLQPLLGYLAGGAVRGDGDWQSWTIRRVAGGMNSLIYRATGPGGDLAVKLTARDSRHRAAREYAALLALERAGLELAPRPVWLDEMRYRQPVVVQSWLEGEVSAAPPATDAEWELLVAHLAAVHSLTPEGTDVPLPAAVIDATSPAACRGLIRRQMARLPAEAQPAALRALVRRWEAYPLPDWPPPPVALCRVDTNTRNFVRRPTGWASVDWENSGWGDPAFEVGELMAHAAYIDVSAERWAWVADRYCSLTGDETCAVRIPVYYWAMLVFWAVRLARFLYEVPRGLDQRLVERPADWQADLQARYEHYLALAEANLRV